jgi:hypothetical protein
MQESTCSDGSIGSYDPRELPLLHSRTLARLGRDRGTLHDNSTGSGGARGAARSEASRRAIRNRVRVRVGGRIGVGHGDTGTRGHGDTGSGVQWDHRVSGFKGPTTV